MKRQWETTTQCVRLTRDKDQGSQCPNFARYVVLMPPLAAVPTPTPVWLDGENTNSWAVQSRPAPLYCRECAYLLCGLSPGGAVAQVPPLGTAPTGEVSHA
jgi:hypothetical protein